MKYRRITLGMGYGDYWNDHSAVGTNTKANILIDTVEQQQAIIKKQKSEIEETKMMVAKLKSEIEKVFSQKLIQNIF
jgi:hypothetical protein